MKDFWGKAVSEARKDQDFAGDGWHKSFRTSKSNVPLPGLAAGIFKSYATKRKEDK